MQYMNKAMTPIISNGSQSIPAKKMYMAVDSYNASVSGNVSDLMSLSSEKSVESSNPELFVVELRKR